jgi:hypothetical protein
MYPAETTRSVRAVLRLVGLPSVARYPEAKVVREEQRLIISFGGLEDEQTMGIPLKYTGSEDGEAAELMLLAQLQRIGYRVQRGSPRAG